MLAELKGLVEGDHAVIRSIYSLYLDKVSDWIKRNNGGRQDAMDVFQEALTQLLLSAKKGKLENVESFSSYLIGTCKYIWLGRIKKESRISSLKEELKNREELVYIQDWQEGEKLTHLRTFLSQNRQKLSETCQRLLGLLANDIKPILIAEELNMTNANTVYRRKFACFKKWRELIEVDPMYQQWKRDQYEF